MAIGTWGKSKNLSDKWARVPFSIVAVLVLIMSVASGAYITQVDQQRSLTTIQKPAEDLEKAAKDLGLDIQAQAYYIAENVIKEYFVENGNRPPEFEKINPETQQRFYDYLDDTVDNMEVGTNNIFRVDVQTKLIFVMAEQQTTTDVYETSEQVNRWPTPYAINVPSGTMELDTARSDVYGETHDVFYMRVVGEVSFTLTSKISGAQYTKILIFDKNIYIPLPLLKTAFDDFQTNSLGDMTDVGRMVRYVVQTLAQYRALLGIGCKKYNSLYDGKSIKEVIKPVDVEFAIKLAILLEQVRRYRTYADTTSSSDYWISSELLKTVEGAGRSINSLINSYVKTGFIDAADLFALYTSMDGTEGEIDTAAVLGNAIYEFGDKFIIDLMKIFWPFDWVDPMLKENFVNWDMVKNLRKEQVQYGVLLTGWVEKFLEWLNLPKFLSNHKETAQMQKLWPWGMGLWFDKGAATGGDGDVSIDDPKPQGYTYNETSGEWEDEEGGTGSQDDVIGSAEEDLGSQIPDLTQMGARVGLAWGFYCLFSDRQNKMDKSSDPRPWSMYIHTVRTADLIIGRMAYTEIPFLGGDERSYYKEEKTINVPILSDISLSAYRPEPYRISYQNVFNFSDRQGIPGVDLEPWWGPNDNQWSTGWDFIPPVTHEYYVVKESLVAKHAKSKALDYTDAYYDTIEYILTALADSVTGDGQLLDSMGTKLQGESGTYKSSIDEVYDIEGVSDEDSLLDEGIDNLMTKTQNIGYNKCFSTLISKEDAYTSEQWFKDSTNKPGGKLYDVIKETMDLIFEAFDTIEQSSNQEVKMIGLGFINGFAGLSKAQYNLWDPYLEYLKGAFYTVVSIIDLVSSSMQILVNEFSRLVKDVLEGIIQLIQDVCTAVNTFLNKVTNEVNKIIAAVNTVVDNINQLFKKVGEVKDKINDLINGFSTAIKDITSGDVLKGFGEFIDLFGSIGDVAESITEVFKQIQTLGASVMGLIDQIMSSFQAIIEGLKQLWEDIKTAFSNFLDGLQLNAYVGIIESYANAILSMRIPHQKSSATSTFNFRQDALNDSFVRVFPIVMWRFVSGMISRDKFKANFGLGGDEVDSSGLDCVMQKIYKRLFAEFEITIKIQGIKTMIELAKVWIGPVPVGILIDLVALAADMKDIICDIVNCFIDTTVSIFGFEVDLCDAVLGFLKSTLGKLVSAFDYGTSLEAWRFVPLTSFLFWAWNPLRIISDEWGAKYFHWLDYRKIPSELLSGRPLNTIWDPFEALSMWLWFDNVGPAVSGSTYKGAPNGGALGWALGGEIDDSKPTPADDKGQRISDSVARLKAAGAGGGDLTNFITATVGGIEPGSTDMASTAKYTVPGTDSWQINTMGVIDDLTHLRGTGLYENKGWLDNEIRNEVKDHIQDNADLINAKYQLNTVVDEPYSMWKGNKDSADFNKTFMSETVGDIQQTQTEDDPQALYNLFNVQLEKYIDWSTAPELDESPYGIHLVDAQDDTVATQISKDRATLANGNMHNSMMQFSMSRAPFETHWRYVRASGFIKLETTTQRLSVVDSEGQAHEGTTYDYISRFEFDFPLVVYTGWSIEGVEYKMTRGYYGLFDGEKATDYYWYHEFAEPELFGWKYDKGTYDHVIKPHQDAGGLSPVLSVFGWGIAQPRPMFISEPLNEMIEYLKDYIDIIFDIQYGLVDNIAELPNHLVSQDVQLIHAINDGIVTPMEILQLASSDGFGGHLGAVSKALMYKNYDKLLGDPISEMEAWISSLAGEVSGWFNNVQTYFTDLYDKLKGGNWAALLDLNVPTIIEELPMLESNLELSPLNLLQFKHSNGWVEEIIGTTLPLDFYSLVTEKSKFTVTGLGGPVTVHFEDDDFNYDLDTSSLTATGKFKIGNFNKYHFETTEFTISPGTMNLKGVYDIMRSDPTSAYPANVVRKFNLALDYPGSLITYDASASETLSGIYLPYLNENVNLKVGLFGNLASAAGDKSGLKAQYLKAPTTEWLITFLQRWLEQAAVKYESGAGSAADQGIAFEITRNDGSVEKYALHMKDPSSDLSYDFVVWLINNIRTIVYNLGNPELHMTTYGSLPWQPGEKASGIKSSNYETIYWTFQKIESGRTATLDANLPQMMSPTFPVMQDYNEDGTRSERNVISHFSADDGNGNTMSGLFERVL